MSASKMQGKENQYWWLFQQDNTKSHSARVAAWLSSKKVQAMKWPAWSPLKTFMK